MSADSVVEYDDHGRPLAPDTVYEPVIVNGKRVGWRLSEADRVTVEAMEKHRAERTGIYAAHTPARKASTEARPIQKLVVELEPWVVLDFGLESELRDAYDLNPHRVTRIVDEILKGCEAQRLHSPGGLLHQKLKDVRQAAD